MKKIHSAGQWLCIGLTVLMALLAVVSYFTDTLASESSDLLIGKHKTGVGMLTETPASQTFTATSNGLSAVDVMFSNYNKKPKTGTLTLWLTDETGAELARQAYAVVEQKNNAFVTLPVSGAKDSAGKQYTLYASSDCTEQKGVTLRMGPMDEGAEGMTLTLADGTVDAENAMYLRRVYAVTNYGKMAAMTCLLLALCFAACIPMAGRKGRGK